MRASKSSRFAEVTLNRVENTETVSSLHTYAHAQGSGDGQGNVTPATSLPDNPKISDISITSSIMGLPASFFEARKKDTVVPPPDESALRIKKENEEEKDAVCGVLPNSAFEELPLTPEGFPLSTQRVEKMSFDMKGVSPPIANLFRRLIIAEVPTLAFDRVLIYENDSVVLDELLSHRLGLVPVAGPVSQMEYITESDQASFQNLDSRRVLIFDLEAEGAKNVAVTPVYSRQLRWVPLPGQEAFQPRTASGDTMDETNSVEDECRVFVVYPDILLTKLGPGQKLKLRAMAIKGLGAVHTKWSPVSACYYEMKTDIQFTEPVKGQAAIKLAKVCSGGVFSIQGSPDDSDKVEDVKKSTAISTQGSKFSLESPSPSATVVVEDAGRCTLCRDCLRTEAYPEFANKLRIRKDKTHVRFHIESVGQLHAAQIFKTALTLFAERVRFLAEIIHSTELSASI